MSAIIPITGIAADFRVPGTYAEILFAQGPSTASAPAREVVFVMPKLSTGSWTVATLYPVNNEQDVITGAASGSPLHRGIRKFLQANKTSKVWALPVAETSGGSPVAATATVTLTNNATATGALTVRVCDEDCTCVFATGATPTQIGDLIVAVINGKTWLPCTAVNVTGTITLTAKLKGVSQGTATIGVIRLRTSITAGVGTTVAQSGLFLGTGAAGVEGSTTEAANLAAALASLVSTRKYYIVSSANDATSLTNIQSHVATKSEPKQGLRSVAITAWTGSLAAGQTLATSRNYERLQIAWQRNSDHDCAEIAGNVAAIRQKYESLDSAFNFASYSDSDWLINPAYLNADWPTPDEQNDAITDGLMPIASRDGDSYVVMSVNTRSKNSTGSLDDFRACETHRVSVADEFTDEVLARVGLAMSGKKLRDDERLANGTVNPNQKARRGVLTPSLVTNIVFQVLDEFDGPDNARLQTIDASKAALRLLKSPANSSRIESGIDLHVIDHAHQFTMRVAEVSTG